MSMGENEGSHVIECGRATLQLIIAIDGSLILPTTNNEKNPCLVGMVLNMSCFKEDSPVPMAGHQDAKLT